MADNKTDKKWAQIITLDGQLNSLYLYVPASVGVNEHQRVGAGIQ